MFGRRALLVISAAATIGLGGGAAFAATHGGTHHSTKPKPAQAGAPPNVHYPCRLDGSGSIADSV